MINTRELSFHRATLKDYLVDEAVIWWVRLSKKSLWILNICISLEVVRLIIWVILLITPSQETKQATTNF